MKKLALAAGALMVLFSACKQTGGDSYTITGDVKGLKDNALYLSFQQNDSAKVDTIHVKDGKFEFTGKAPATPVFGQVVTQDGTHGFPVFLEPGGIQVTGNADSAQYIVSGTPNNNALKEMMDAQKPMMQKMKAFQQEYMSARMANDTAKVAALESEYDGLQKEMDGVMKTFVSSHPKALISAMLLQQLSTSLATAESEKLFNGLDTSVQHGEFGKMIADKLAADKKTDIGQPAPDFTENDVNGNPVSLASFKGKYVLVDFWASWCGPCRQENPNVVKAYNQYKNKNFTILGVSLDEDSSKWKEAITQDKLAWNHVSDLKGWKNAAAQEYGVQAIPANFLLGPDGKIIGKNLRGEDLDKKLAEVLK